MRWRLRTVVAQQASWTENVPPRPKCKAVAQLKVFADGTLQDLPVISDVSVTCLSSSDVPQSGLTPLHLAAQEDKVNVAEVLVNHGATIDPETKVTLRQHPSRLPRRAAGSLRLHLS